MTTRRDALLTLPLLCATSRVRAQAPKAGQSKRVGYLGGEDPRPLAERPTTRLLRQKGWILGDNLLADFIYIDGKTTVEQFPELAEELVRRRVDLMVTGGDAGTVAAARASRTIPIVFFNVLFPLELGLIDSYARPGRNATGLAHFAGLEVTYKRLAFLREVLPTARRLSWILPGDWLPTVAGGRFDLAATLEAGARGLGFETRFHLVRSPQEVDAAFGDIATWRAQAVMVAGPWVVEVQRRVAELLLRHRLPSAYLAREDSVAGGLLSFGPVNLDDDYLSSRLIDYVDHVLRGTAPADLPVERPNRYELVINMRTAKALGLTIPQSLLARADEVIP